MTLLYLDTNVILARYAPSEPQHESAKDIIRWIEAGRIDAVTSVFTLVEVVCVTARAYERFIDKDETTREDVAAAFLRRVANFKNLKFIPMGGEISFKVAGQQLKFPAVLAEALEIGAKTGLKTLDNVHLAAANVASKLYAQKIDYFATMDEEILRHREEVRAYIEARVSTPAEIAEIEKRDEHALL